MNIGSSRTQGVGHPATVETHVDTTCLEQPGASDAGSQATRPIGSAPRRFTDSMTSADTARGSSSAATATHVDTVCLERPGFADKGATATRPIGSAPNRFIASIMKDAASEEAASKFTKKF